MFPNSAEESLLVYHTFPISLVWSYTTTKDCPSSIFLPSLSVNSSERLKHRNASQWTPGLQITHKNIPHPLHVMSFHFHFHIDSSATDISYAFLSQFFSNIWCPKSSCCTLRLRPAALGSSRAGGVAGVHHLLHSSAPLSLFPGWFFRPAARLTGAPPLGPLSLFLAPAARPLRHLHGGIAAWRRGKGRMKWGKKRDGIMEHKEKTD